MQLLLLMVVCVAFVPFETFPDGMDASKAACLTWGGVLAVALLGEAASWLLAWRFRQRSFRPRLAARLYNATRLLHVGTILSFYLYALFGLNWGGAVRVAWRLDEICPILLGDILILAPFVAMVVCGWSSFYRVECALVGSSGQVSALPFWGRWPYVAFHARHYLGLVIAPVLLFKGIQETLNTVFAGSTETEWFQWLSVVCLMAAVLLAAPWLLTKIWHARALPSGPLRTRLEKAAQRLGFRYTQILLWNTRGGMANAMVTGMFAAPRYILLSDGLLQGLSDDEVEAVFGHEMGHVKHHHMPLYMGFAILSLFCLIMLGNLVVERFGPLLTHDTNQVLSYLLNWQDSMKLWGSCFAGVALLGGYVWLVFGFLSRRCERQADVYGCKAVSCHDPNCAGHDGEPILSTSANTLCPTGIRTFIRALEKVADLNGIRRDKYSWRHASISRRVAFLEKLVEKPEEERQFQRRLGMAKVALIMALCASCIALLWLGGNLVEAMKNM